MRGARPGKPGRQTAGASSRTPQEAPVCARWMVHITPSMFAGHPPRRTVLLQLLWERCEWAEFEDTEKMFTRGAEIAQVLVGVKKNRPR